ncbi:MAG: hypothetical protein IKA88_03305, partial [Clostridia bacterium]|nr:hypothetical protein [Clostridia bacterium]
TNINMNDFASIIKHSSIYQQAWVGIGATWTDWNSGTLDGRGYSVENFFAWNMFGVYKEYATIKNIGLKYDQWIQNVNHLDGVFGGITATNMTMENVWIDMTVSKDAAAAIGLSEWFVFGNTVNGCTIKDVVVNVNVIGNANVAIRSGAKAGTIANNIENVYVMSSSTIGANTMNTWSGVKVISQPSEITSIGGNFVIEGNSIKYSGKTVYTWTKPNVAETVSEKVYTESADFALADLGVTGTLVSATPAVVENGVLKATGLVMGDNVYTVVTETEDAIYTYTITIVRAEMIHGQLAQQYTDQAALEVAVDSLNLEGTLVSVKTAAGVDVVVADGIIELVDLVSGENKFVITTATTRYSMNVIKYDMEISSMADIEAWAAGGKQGKYAVLTQDIDATGYVATNVDMSGFASSIKHSSIYNQAWIGINPTTSWAGANWTSGTLDGRGYRVDNFFAWNMWGVTKQNVTIRNIGLKYDQWIQNVNHLDGVFGYETSNVTLENAWIDMTVSKDAAAAIGLSEWFVFGNMVAGCTIKDVVVNVNVIGSANVNIRSGAKNGSIANNIENVYIISTSTIGANTMNTWSGVQVVSQPSEITTIGGNFEVKADGLYYNNKLVKAVSAS